MTARDFMLQVRRAEEELIAISSMKQHYEELATSISVNLTGMPGKKMPSSRVETGAVELADLITDLAVKEQEYVKLISKARETIAKIQQANFRNVLILKYMCRLSPRIIKEKMRFDDPKSVNRCEKHALNELQKVM